MKIVHVITGLGIGGAEKVVYDLCKASMNDTDNQMEVVVLDVTNHRLKDFNDIGIKVTNLNMKKSISSVKDALNKLKEIFMEGRVDIVHAHMSHPAVIMTMYNIFNKKIPFVFTPHSVDIESKWRELFLWLNKSKRNHDILFAEDHHQFYNKNLEWSVLPNGIDLEYLYQIAKKQKKSKKFTFITVARLTEAKNQLFLLDVIAKLKQNGNDFKLIMVGDGELREQIEQRIKSNNIQDVVEMLGLRKDIPQLLGTAHVFLLPSKWEGLPISVLEAGAAKLPVITTDVGSLPDLLSNQRGISVKESDYYAQLQFSIENYDELLCNSERLYQYLGDNYSMKSVYKKHIILYKNNLI